MLQPILSRQVSQNSEVDATSAYVHPSVESGPLQVERRKGLLEDTGFDFELKSTAVLVR